MDTMTSALRAYSAAAARRSPRQQEADVFRRVNAGLRNVRAGSDALARVRAFVDNDRLWRAVRGLVSDPRNQLPAPLRAQLASIAVTVERELQQRSPDIDFLIAVNENIAQALEEGGHPR